MKKIPLGHDRFTLVDNVDCETWGQRRWFQSNKGYAISAGELLHRLIMDAPPGFDVDHIDGDKLDNRRCNLRLATRSQNLANQKKAKNNTSGFKGVCWNKGAKKWQAYIHSDKRQHHLGLFVDRESAARAYDDAARERFGAFARTNFPVKP